MENLWRVISCLTQLQNFASADNSSKPVETRSSEISLTDEGGGVRSYFNQKPSCKTSVKIPLKVADSKKSGKGSRKIHPLNLIND